ncbi:MAG: hypothetical protein Unbinned5081contig1002_43 [Prokaryotic dsDNA virus sp.]|nr:MAG: hypothetical protein Unbinned5081contig1002_43 [Prokaryotic dsDNA virus sp.]|tara:strand:+ start:26630 stop:26953 length:324 start_codon:yes stop_codon:yes gene_type:complete
MSLRKSITITADGSTTIPLKNVRGKDRTIYSVYLSDDFGSGTVTAFLEADGTNNIAIKDAAGVAISLTDDDVFNFEAYSDEKSPVNLVITLTGSSSPSINLNVYDNR